MNWAPNGRSGVASRTAAERNPMNLEYVLPMSTPIGMGFRAAFVQKYRTRMMRPVRSRVQTPRLGLTMIELPRLNHLIGLSDVAANHA